MLCFWFAVDNGSLEEAQLIYRQDRIISLIMKNLRERGAEYLDTKEASEEEDDESREASAVDVPRSDADGAEAGSQAATEQGLHIDNRYNFTSKQDLR